jgi:hypothetical protein
MKITLTISSTWMRLASDPARLDMRSILRRALLLSFVMLAAGATRLQAQDTPRIQVFGGYSYTNFDSKTLGYSGASGLNGGTIMAAGNITHGFGALAQASVGGGSGITVRDALFGPQFLYPRGRFLLFAHGMFGRARSSVHTGAMPEPLDTQNAMAFGGGVDMNYRHHLGIRLIQVDYVRTQLFQHDQNNLRFSTGLVYQWGAIRRKGHRAPSIPTP